jgi:hypothetical protein
MAQITLYLPDAIASRIKHEAKKAHKSLSAYVTELASKRVTPSGWPAKFSRLYGSWKGEVPEIADPPPDEIDGVA